MSQTLNEAWRSQLSNVMVYGSTVSPRGQLTKELPQRTLVFDMNHPVITFPSRNMGYRFMAAEAWWILSGRDDVASIAPYSKEISRFSDDGEHFFGAYGPKIVDQLDYVVAKLLEDVDTRQAGLTTWRENPPASKDIPCTIALWFQIRDGLLNLHVFMRSSDNWLGIPYDAFNFSMVACEVARRVNTSLKWGLSQEHALQLGTCYLTAASSHLYERNFDAAYEVLNDTPEPTGPVPPYLYGIYKAPPTHYYGTVRYLELLKDTDRDESKFRWWILPRPTNGGVHDAPL